LGAAVVTGSGYLIVASALVVVFGEMTLMGCSGSREDVRVTLCKDMVAVQVGPAQSISWTGNETQTRGYEHAAVKLRFTAQGRAGEAVCYYKYNAVEDTALTLSEPLSAYSTSPYEMSLNGRVLSRSALARAIKDAMAKQGSELVDRFKKGFQ
jgi:hypothetical protein